MSLKTRSIFWESLSASQIFSSRCPGQLKIEIIIKRSRFSAKSEDIYWGLTSINPSNNYKKLFLVLFLFEAIWWERILYSADSPLFLVRKFRLLKTLKNCIVRKFRNLSFQHQCLNVMGWSMIVWANLCSLLLGIKYFAGKI